MACGEKVFAGVLIFGAIAASHMATREAHAERNPLIAGLETILTTVCAGFDVFDLIEMCTLLCHYIVSPGAFSACKITSLSTSRLRSSSFLNRIQLLPTLTLPNLSFAFSAMYSPFSTEQM